MKLLRFGEPGAERPALLDPNGEIRELTSLIPDLSGDALSPGSLAQLRQIDPETLPIVHGARRFGPCIAASENSSASGSTIPIMPPN
ncbi:MAG: 2-hydroxyhepta-2,4-diene-1,7-dioate isomerase, partial [Silvibacterium sp.]|nr:2-hydroxyhepta-2,4-diene-1,7-dioate isomerase [Silvibacterium sp.]